MYRYKYSRIIFQMKKTHNSDQKQYKHQRNKNKQINKKKNQKENRYMDISSDKQSFTRKNMDMTEKRKS